jgi:hypothetical protein
MALAALLVVLGGSAAACGKPKAPDGPPTSGATGVGAYGSGDDGSGSPASSAPADPGCTSTNDTPGVAVVAERDRLVLADGRAFPLTAANGGAWGGYQTCDGWLIDGMGPAGAPRSLWLLGLDGSLKQIVDKSEADVAVAPDGRHISWRWQDTLYFGRVDPAGGVHVDVRSPAPAQGHPITMTETAVVLGYTTTGGGIDHHDVWFPSRGNYVPTWTTDILAVFGPTKDRRYFLGLFDGGKGVGQPCLAEFDPQQALHVAHSACGLETIRLYRSGQVSPDGKQLAVSISGSGGLGIGTVDLTTVFTTPAFAHLVFGTDLDPLKLAWEDNIHVLAVSTSGGLTRFALPSGPGAAAPRVGVSATTEVTALLPRLEGTAA